jgi:hypothetical protein
LTIGGTQALQGALPVHDWAWSSRLGEKLRRFGLEADAEALVVVRRNLLLLERRGWQMEDAEGSLVLVVLRCLRRHQPWFEVQRYSVLARGAVPEGEEAVPVEASVKLKADGVVRHVVREGNGAVEALGLALQEALRATYPRLEEVALQGYTASTINPPGSLAGPVRVRLESWDSVHRRSWGTVAVAHDIVLAGLLALIDSFQFKRWLDTQQAAGLAPPA